MCSIRKLFLVSLLQIYSYTRLNDCGQLIYKYWILIDLSVPSILSSVFVFEPLRILNFKSTMVFLSKQDVRICL